MDYDFSIGYATVEVPSLGMITKYKAFVKTSDVLVIRSEENIKSFITLLYDDELKCYAGTYLGFGHFSTGEITE